MTNYRTYENKELLSLLYQDNEGAFTELYNRFWKKLFVLAYNRIKEVQTAEDIVHDVFVSLWVNREKVEIESLENYLATTVKYMVLAKIKKKEQERIYNNYSLVTPIIEMSAETSLHYKRILEIVKNEVERLPEKCKLIFKFSREEGMPVKQIATQLRISPKTVENQIGKALKQLRLAARTFLHLF